MTSPDDLLLGPDGNKYPTYKHACRAWDFIGDSKEYVTAMHEANQMGWYGKRLLNFFGDIIVEGDATNIAEIWNGFDPNEPGLSEEERMYPNGMKHLMMTIPQKLYKQGLRGRNYMRFSDNNKSVTEKHTLKKLAFYLEQQGCDYPEELPPLPEDLELELSNDWIHAHKADPDESFRTYNNNKSSNFLLNLLSGQFKI